MRTLLSIPGGVWLLVVSCCAAHGLFAQPPLPSRAEVDAKIAASVAESAKRIKIMTSPEWKQVQTEFAKWQSEQVVYTRAQLLQLNAKIEHSVRTLPADELQEFIDDWNAKLKLVLGKPGDEAREWLGVYMTNMSDGYQKRYLKSLGVNDIANLTAGQLEAKISQVRGQKVALQQDQAAFDRSRQEGVNLAQQAVAASQAAQRTSNVASGYSSGPSPYAPTKPTWDPPRINFSVDSDGRFIAIPW